MNSQLNKMYSGMIRGVTAGVILLALFAVVAPRAEANTAAGTQLTNSITVTFKDAAGTVQTPATANVTVTVSLVGGVAWGTVPGDKNTGSGQALPSAYTITLHNTGNGSDQFTITDLTSQPGTLTAGSFTITTTPATLFGTVTSGAGVYSAPNTTIPVTYLVTGDATAGKTVMIGTNTYTIVSATSTSLVVSGDAHNDASAYGVQIGEVYTVTYNGTAGTLTAGTSTADHTHSLRATGLSQNGNTAATQDSSTWLTHVNGPTLDVKKYVRNSSNSNGNTNGTGGVPLYGNTYYTGGVTGNSGNTLEYVVIVKNTNTDVSGSSTAVILEETFPSYTTYVVSQPTNKIDYGTGTLAALPSGDTEACGQNPGIFETDTCSATNPTKLKVFLGTGALEGATYGATGTGGTIPGGNNTAATWAVLYQLTIK